MHIDRHEDLSSSFQSSYIERVGSNQFCSIRYRRICRWDFLMRILMRTRIFALFYYMKVAKISIFVPKGLFISSVHVAQEIIITC